MSGEAKNVVIEKRFSASPERVFDAWLDPERVKKWMVHGSEKVVSVTVEARIGGKFTFVVLRAGEEVDHTGEYLELDRPHRLSFTWRVPKYSNDASIVRIAFESDGEGTRVTLTQEGVPAEFEERTQKGWGTIVDLVVQSIG